LNQKAAIFVVTESPGGMENHPSLERLEGPERALKALGLFLANACDFHLCATTYSDLVRRDFWIAQLKERLTEDRIHLSVLDFQPLNQPSLLADILNHLQTEETPPDWRRVVAMTGLEDHVTHRNDHDSHRLSGPNFLKESNLDYQRFIGECPVPIISWMTHSSLAIFKREAPDLWRSHVHIFDFDERSRGHAGHGDSVPVNLETVTPSRVFANQEELTYAVSVFREELSKALGPYGPSHPTTCRARANLGNAVRQLGEYDEALQLFRDNLAAVQSGENPSDADLGAAFGSLGLCLKDLGEYAEAEFLLRRALEVVEAGFGRQHPAAAIALSNLATLFQNTRKFDEAEPLLRRALEIDEGALGEDDPSIAIRLNNLAALLQDTARFEEAEPLMRRALLVAENAFGPEHPDIAVRVNNLASLLYMTGRAREAEPLMRRALAIGEKCHGRDHPTVATRLNNLAQLLHSTDRASEAEPLMRQALEILFLFKERTQHEYQTLKQAVKNYVGLLQEKKWNREVINMQLESLLENARKQAR
jgi:tetratricopeptide (TPR) repeat protein